MDVLEEWRQVRVLFDEECWGILHDLESVGVVDWNMRQLHLNAGEVRDVVKDVHHLVAGHSKPVKLLVPKHLGS
jgi:hypothetical protein